MRSKSIFCIFLVAILCINFSCKSPLKILKKGEVIITESITKVPIDIKTKLPFVKVEINGKEYNFLFDTGAITCISFDLYKELQLKSKSVSNIYDSEGNEKEETITILPQLKMGSILMKNVGCVVINFDSFEFKCTKIDGVIGSNHIKDLFVKVNNQEKIIEFTKDFSLLDKTGFDKEWSFIEDKQYRPILISNFYGKKMGFVFDTGANSYIDITKKFVDEVKDSIKSPIITFEGHNSVGIYGKDKKNKSIYYFKPEQLKIADHSFNSELVSTGSTNLIGNDYLEHFDYILDWKHKKIYFKELDRPNTKKKFSFSPGYSDNKFIVSSILKTENHPLRLGEVIVSINGQKIDKMSQEELCNLFLNNYKFDTITIEVLRDNQVLPFTFTREDFFK
ncbi:hypothetical protein CAPN010_17300 [Capnocytophaga cynodegmi]|uniref:aspartyl protease family protein n=1 Tax=Capnocytophaga cynodegmi TaxID=28189 RepID=UPI001EE29EE7|nr:aspartyl protease family protein [Capnocytophaga cynodegmi]GJQ07572.1 hypothetical protein CAPN010_17300 [Capnocytophaga cynodegmi]